MDTEPDEFSKQIGLKTERKIRAHHAPARSIWLGFGVTGVIGWSVALPSLLGALLGYWLDEHYPSGHSWTLALLVAGLCLGCFQAWMWVVQEDKAMHAPEDTPGGVSQDEQKDEQKDEQNNA